MFTFTLYFMLPFLAALLCLLAGMELWDRRMESRFAARESRIREWEKAHPFQDAGDFWRNGASHNERA